MSKVFGELTRDEKLALLTAWVDGATIEIKTTDASYWATTQKPAWWPGFAYRIAKKTKPSVDWTQVSERFNYLSRDSTGEAFFYTKAPGKMNTRWMPVSGSEMCNADIFTSFNPGNCDWRKSLVARPGVEE